MLGPLMGLFVVLALAANIGQSGLLFAPKKLKPKLNKISLRSGIKRLFSFRALNEFLKGIVKLVVVSAVAFGLALPMLLDVELIPSREIITTLGRLNAVALALFGGTVAVMTVIAILDFAYQKYAFFKQMRMTKQEVKDEHKQTEGDPLVRARIRKLRVERAQRRMMAAVPQADVVVTNPIHYAVALEYKMVAMVAPRVIAKGVDSLAQAHPRGGRGTRRSSGREPATGPCALCHRRAGPGDSARALQGGGRSDRIRHAAQGRIAARHNRNRARAMGEASATSEVSPPVREMGVPPRPLSRRGVGAVWTSVGLVFTAAAAAFSSHLAQARNPSSKSSYSARSRPRRSVAPLGPP